MLWKLYLRSEPLTMTTPIKKNIKIFPDQERKQRKAKDNCVYVMYELQIAGKL